MAISTKASPPAELSHTISAVSCPKCGAAIPITEALSQQAREQVSRDFAIKQQQMEQQLAERERQIQQSREEISAARAKLDEELKTRLETEKAQLTTTLRKEIDAQKGHELTVLQERLDRQSKQITEANDRQAQLLRQKAELEEKEARFKLELQQQLESARVKATAELSARLEKEKTEIAARLRQELELQKGNELSALKEQLASRDRQIKLANDKELELLRQKADLEDQKSKLNLEVARQLDAERNKVAEQARNLALEESRLKMAEKDKLTEDLRKQIETLQQKANQGSVQMQGEVLELDFEAKLRAEFPFDEIAPTTSGQRGADVRQTVRTSPTHICGSILWEAKRTRAWSAQWIPKLKSDQRDAKAELAVIVTQALPKEITSFGCQDGIWITDFENALPLALCLRQQLVQVAAIRQAETGKHGKMEELYAYMTSAQFIQQVTALADAFKAMAADLESERNAMERIWAKREKQIRLAVGSTMRLYGSVQAVTGAALPDVPALALPAAE